MKALPTFFLSALALLAPSASVRAADLGDPAAPLQIAEWVKGQPVDLAAGKGKTIYVVEFWATWCPPCRASIPHLTELQKKFKEVVFIGISDEKVPTVKTFVEKMGDKMDYVVAVDKERKTSAGYMAAYGANGIPHAFVVDKQGRVVWEGHPMADLEKTLEALIAGKYDMSVAKKRARSQELLQQFFELVSEGKDETKANEVAKELEALDQELGGVMQGRKFDAAEVRKMVKFQSAMRAYQQAVVQGKDEDEVETLAKTAESVAPKEVKFAEIKQQFQLQSLFQNYMKVVTGQGDETKAAQLAKKLAAVEAKNPEVLNEMAWALLTDPKIKKRDTGLALKLAQGAYDGGGNNDAAVLDTYARALFDNGKTQDAITYQKKAVELAKDNQELREQLGETLKKYQEKAAK